MVTLCVIVCACGNFVCHCVCQWYLCVSLCVPVVSLCVIVCACGNFVCHCVCSHRVLPHHQDTGGFFVAALRKVRHLPWSREAHTEKGGTWASHTHAHTRACMHAHIHIHTHIHTHTYTHTHIHTHTHTTLSGLCSVSLNSG